MDTNATTKALITTVAAFGVVIPILINDSSLKGSTVFVYARCG